MHIRQNTWTKVALVTLLSPLPLLGQFNANIAGYWPLDSNLLDASSNKGDGAFQTTGATTPQYTAGGIGAGTAKFGEAINLKFASAEHILINGAGNAGFKGENFYDFTGGNMTISLWATNTAFTSSWQALAGKGEGSSWRLSRRAEDNFLAYAGGLGNDSAEGTSNASTGLHHIVAVTNANRGLSLYVDGVLESHVKGNPAITDSTFFMALGANPQSPGRSWNGTIDDALLFGRALTGPEVATLYNAGAGTRGSDVIASIDSDLDLIPDFYEIANGLNPAVNDANGDRDSDGLNNLAEYNARLGANNPDADNDGLNDGDEFANNGDPFNPDTDGDGLTDGDEVHLYLTLVNNPDSDNDQASDFDEVKAGTNPNDDTDFPSSWSIGLVGYWNFDNNLLDTSGTGANGTFVSSGAGTLTYGAGKFNNGILLNNTNAERIEIQSVVEDTYDFTGGSMSASLWCSTSGFTQSWQGILAKGEGDSWRIARNGDSNAAAFNPGNWKVDGDDITGGNIGTPGFHHVVAVTNVTGTGQLWVDGVKVAETTAPPIIANNALNLMIGGNPGAGGDNFRTWPGTLDEVAIWKRPLSSGEIGRLYKAGEGATVQSLIDDPDTDGDGLPDSWEIANSTDRFTDDSGADPDNDGSTNLQEFNAGTDPNDNDSDDDGLLDGAEATAGSDPLIADTDRDGLTDGAEVNTHMTSPILRDTDSDGFSDALEIEYATNPNLNTSFPSLDQGLLGYWPLDEDLIDGTNSGGNGTYNDNLVGSPNFVAGKFGNGILLNHANNQYVRIDGAGETPPDYTQVGGSVTISVWTSVSTFIENWQGLVARGEGTAWRIANRGTGADGFIAYAGGGPEPSGGPLVNDGLFHHIVAVSEKGFNARLYIDGVKVADSGTTAPNITDNGNNDFITIGSNPNAITRSWNGTIDDVAIWARPLSDTEITGLFTSAQSLGEQLGLGVPALLQVTDIVRATNGNINLTWSSKESTEYSVLYTTDLSLPIGRWSVAEDAVVSGGATTSFTVPAITLGGAAKVFFVIQRN